MTTTTQTLADWLLEQIAADEAAASRAGSFTPWTDTFQVDNCGHLTVQPDRVLAECESKRAIIASVERAMRLGTNGLGPSVLRALAQPYRDAPGWQEAWSL